MTFYCIYIFLGQKVGVLSTRSPHRPNNIGLSVCEIVHVCEDYIEVKGIDFVHGTPILDSKSFIPVIFYTSSNIYICYT